MPFYLQNVNTMHYFWITGTIALAVLMYFMMSAVFGFNILIRICQQVWYRVVGEGFMEEVR